jgi:hypothetical protein
MMMRKKKRRGSMEKNGVTKAKPAVNLAKKNAKKQRKIEKKEQKKKEKRERKDIKSAYMKALKKSNPDKILSLIAVLLTVAPIVVQFIVDRKEEK